MPNTEIVLTLPETNQMHDQDRKFMQDWEKTREKGRWYYGQEIIHTFICNPRLTRSKIKLCC